MALIKHPFHPDHELSLILRNEKNQNDGETNTCKVCQQEILSSSYGCRECCFHLHKICAELPQSIQRSVERYGHREHDLKLLERPSYSVPCDDCGERCEAFIYLCTTTTCSYRVCICCASRAQIVQHASHKHRLRPLLRQATFLCDACCTEHKGFSYQCLNCGFWIQEYCASLPIILRRRGHHHPLILFFSSPIKSFPGEVNCWICEKNLNKKSWLYQCRICKFYVHPTCMANIEIENVDELAQIEAWSRSIVNFGNKPDDFPLGIIKETVQGDSDEKIELNEMELLNKFGYQLTLKSESELSSSKKCIACLFPISNYPFYYSSCSDNGQFCEIFLHKWCAALPSKGTQWNYICHPHKLILKGYRLDEERKHFRCTNCQYASNGFTFQCQECRSYCLDLRCFFLPGIFMHQFHKHPLFISEDCLSQHCVACNRNIDEFSFGCSICNVNLHYTCALLPLEFQHRYDKHPFVLNYHSIKDDEYYCEICEDDIDPMLWFYDCKKCRQSVCLRCMWENKKPFPHIPNWVRTYFYETHPHPLQLVLGSWGTLCDLCGHSIDDNFAYGCEVKGCKGKKLHRECTKGYRKDSLG